MCYQLPDPAISFSSRCFRCPRTKEKCLTGRRSQVSICIIAKALSICLDFLNSQILERCLADGKLLTVRPLINDQDLIWLTPAGSRADWFSYRLFLLTSVSNCAPNISTGWPLARVGFCFSIHSLKQNGAITFILLSGYGVGLVGSAAKN